jgi:hypothetical protein
VAFCANSGVHGSLPGLGRQDRPRGCDRVAERLGSCASGKQSVRPAAAGSESVHLGGQETLLLAARYPGPLSAGTGRLAGAAAFDSTCDLSTQCAYLTNLTPGHGADPPSVAARMIEEVGARPGSLRGFRQAATFFSSKLQRHMTIAQLLSELPQKKSLWDERSPLHHAGRLARLPFPLRLYWSSHDTIVGEFKLIA